MDGQELLELHGSDHFFYYCNAYIMYLVAIGFAGLAVHMFIQFSLGHPPPNYSFAVRGFLVSAAVMALLTFQYQHKLKKQLRFRIIHTDRPAKSNYAKVKGTLMVTPWRIKADVNESEIQCLTGISLFSFGDRVTVYFRGQDVWVNSICDPQVWGGGLFGPHERNIQVIQGALT